MANLFVIYKNHFDLTWRRPRYSAGRANAPWSITPYAELQERQLDRALDFVRAGGVYDIEQTITLREYLERNPDLLEEITGMIRTGRLNVMGGGESVVDYNLPDGESIIRNHLYARLWLRDTFGTEPELACLPDTFGLSAGLPGLFRQLGYRGLSEFHRVFTNRKPYWKGLSGDIVALDSIGFGAPVYLWEPSRKARVCTLCAGKGCPACGGSGMEGLDSPGEALNAEDIAAWASALPADQDAVLFLTGEECRVPEDMMEILRTAAERTGRTLRFTGMEEYRKTVHRELLAGADAPDESLIDPRPEGNPVAAGCYTSRIRLKQECRLCESALRTAERLASAVCRNGEPYPAKTFEYWWRKMAFLHFHDAVPASHSDDAYAELMETARSIRQAVSRLIERYGKKLLKTAGTEGEGIPFAVINPLEFSVQQAKLTGTVRCEDTVTGGRVIAPDGTVCPVVSVKHSTVPDSAEALVEFFGDLPPFGYAVFRFIPDEAEHPAPVTVKKGRVMENEYLRVTFSASGIREVYDKEKQCVIAGEGTFAPVISDDAGHPWGRSGPCLYSERADFPVFEENMLPAKEYSVKITAEDREGLRITRVHVRYAREEKPLHSLSFTASFLLPDHSRELYAEIRTAFDAKDFKLSTRLVLPDAPDSGLMDCEIPLGRVSRGPVELQNRQLGYADEWAVLRYVSAAVHGTEITLCNSGTPGHSINGNEIHISLLRNPTQLCCGFGFDGASDPSEHTFTFTLSAAGVPYRRGMVCNTAFPAFRLRKTAGDETGGFLALPDTAPLLALKGAENGQGQILRYLGTEKETILRFPFPVIPCGILEDSLPDAEAVTEAVLPPYTIRTFRTAEA